jgi:hypothetical protein
LTQRQESRKASRGDRLFEGRKTLKGEIPGTLEPEKRFRGFGRSKPLRGSTNPESGTNRARQTLEKWTPDSGKR